MNSQGSFGLQWKLTAIFLAVSLLGCGLVVVGFALGTAFGLEPTAALAVGAGAGLAVGLAGTAAGTRLVRAMKLRLWDAGDMAEQIARGDFKARLPICDPDEIGQLEIQLNSMAGHLEQAVGDLRRLAEQNRLLTEEAGRGAALEERTKLARDLHDTVNQQLFVLAMRAAAARKRLEKLGGDAALLVPDLVGLEDLARQAHSETRGLILQLRPTTLEQQGLGPALTEYSKTVCSRDGLTVVDEVDPSVRIGGAAAANLFRVAQEALNNVSKHARASTVWVTLGRSEGMVTLRIRDDGVGFDPKEGVRPTAVGLVGIQERVAALGGTVRVRSAPGEGTDVTVTMPLPEGGATP